MRMLWPAVVSVVTVQSFMTSSTLVGTMQGLHGGVVLSAIGATLLGNTSTAPILTSSVATLVSTIADLESVAGAMIGLVGLMGIASQELQSRFGLWSLSRLLGLRLKLPGTER